MQPAKTLTVFGVITDFLATNPTPQAILDFDLPESLHARAADLLERNADDVLSTDEKEELFDFVKADEMMSLLKAKTELKSGA